MVNIFLGVLSKAGSTILGVLLANLVTEKFLIKVFLVLAGKLVKSTKNDLDDQLYAAIKETLEK